MQSSNSEKIRYEELFGDPVTGAVTRTEIASREVNDWLFKTDTVDKVLHFVMDHGLKVDGGDRLGKTIIFANNHRHAVFIEGRFNKNYPEYGGAFLRVIDNYADKAQDLLERFCDDKQDQEPQIAVSVDMMDTGIDAPRALNLVLFKPVRSQTKFSQMIGRGTRLRPGLFGPDRDKTHFLIFDFGGNFTFFDLQPDDIPAGVAKSLSQRIFETRLELIMALREAPGTSAEDEDLMNRYTNELHTLINGLDTGRFQVRRRLEYVHTFSDRSRWNNLSKSDVLDIHTHLAGLPYTQANTEELAKRFDLLILRLQLAVLSGKGEKDSLAGRVQDLAKELYKKRNIPLVKARIKTITAVQQTQFWKNISLPKLEEIRVQLRDLMHLIDKEKQRPVYTDFTDEMGESTVRDIGADITGSSNLHQYRERVETFIKEHRHHLVIDKLYRNVPLNKQELQALENFMFDNGVGSKQEYEAVYGKEPLGRFIRSIVGLDMQVAQQLFADFIQTGNLNANQITFLNRIIRYLSQKGTLDKNLLTQPPFNRESEQGIYGMFPEEEQLSRIISVIDRVNQNAERA